MKQLKLRWLFIASLINNTGAALLWPLTTVYVNKYLGKSMTTAGWVMFFITIAMMIGNYMGGWLFDHWRPYLALLIPVAIATVASVALIFYHGWPSFAILFGIVSWSDGASITVVNSYATSMEGKNLRHVFNSLYFAQNVGVVIGTLLVGFLLPISVTLTFEVTAVFYVAYLLVVAICFRAPITRPQASQGQEERGSAGGKRVATRVIYTVCLTMVAIYLGYSLWESVMSVHIVNMGLPFSAYSMLWTINGIIIVIFQPLVTKLDHWLSVRGQIMVGVAFFAVSFAFLLVAHNFWLLLVDFIILTVGEMLGIPAVPVYIGELAGAGAVGKYQGYPTVATSIGRAVGPLFGGWMVDAYSYNALFLCVTVIIVAAMALLALVIRADDRKTAGH